MIEIDESMMIGDLANSLFWWSDCNSDSELNKDEVAQQLYAKLMDWA